MAWFVTFYSYKGGVGRTVALANTAWALAARGRRVVVLDLDLEAPSLSQRPELAPEGDGLGVVDLALGFAATGTVDGLERAVRPCPQFEGSGGLWILPAGLPGDVYARELGRIDWGALAAMPSPDGFTGALRRGLSSLEGIQPHFVLIDARTGFSDAGGLSTHLLADEVVLVFHPDRDGLAGTAQAFRSMQRAHRGDLKPLRFVLVASKLPPGNDPRVDERLARARELMPEAAGLGGERLIRVDYDPALALEDGLAVQDPERFPAAASRFERLREQIQRDDPAEVYAVEEAARDLQSKGRITEALAGLDAFVERYPGHSEGHAAVGRLQLSTGNSPLAVAAFRRAVAAAPSIATFRRDLGEALLAHGDEKGAVEALREAERRGERSERLYEALVRAHQAVGEQAAAGEAQRKGLLLLLQRMKDPEAPPLPSQVLRERFLAVARRVELPDGLDPEEAWDLIRYSPSLAPGERARTLAAIIERTLTARRARSLFRTLRRERERLQERFGAALGHAWARMDESGVDPSDPEALEAAAGEAAEDAVLLVLAADGQSDHAKRLTLLQRAAELAPEAAWAWAALGPETFKQWEGATEEPDRSMLQAEAINAHRRWVALDPAGYNAWFSLGYLLHEGSPGTEDEQRRCLLEAAECYQRVVALDPDSPGALNNWGSVLCQLASGSDGPERLVLLEEACGLYLRAAELYEQDEQDEEMAPTLDNLVEALLDQSALVTEPERTQLLREAVAQAERANELSPGIADYNLACTRSRLGELDTAQAVLIALLGRKPKHAIQALGDSDFEPLFAARPELRARVEALAAEHGAPPDGE